jgi:hypothetical protein
VFVHSKGAVSKGAAFFFVADLQALVYLYLLKYVKIFGGKDIMLIFVPSKQTKNTKL